MEASPLPLAPLEGPLLGPGAPDLAGLGVALPGLSGRVFEDDADDVAGDGADVAEGAGGTFWEPMASFPFPPAPTAAAEEATTPA